MSGKVVRHVIGVAAWQRCTYGADLGGQEANINQSSPHAHQSADSSKHPKTWRTSTRPRRWTPRNLNSHTEIKGVTDSDRFPWTLAIKLWEQKEIHSAYAKQAFMVTSRRILQSKNLLKDKELQKFCFINSNSLLGKEQMSEQLILQKCLYKAVMALLIK